MLIYWLQNYDRKERLFLSLIIGYLLFKNRKESTLSVAKMSQGDPHIRLLAVAIGLMMPGNVLFKYPLRGCLKNQRESAFILRNRAKVAHASGYFR